MYCKDINKYFQLYNETIKYRCRNENTWHIVYFQRIDAIQLCNR